MKVLIIDMQKCTGCRNCELICSAIKEKEFIPSKSRIKIVNFPREGISIPNTCLQCVDNPECQNACPFGAINRSDFGALIVDEDLCTGCGQCVDACPHGMIEIIEEKAAKCDLCSGEPKCIEYCYSEAIKYEELEGEFKEKYELQQTNPHMHDKSSYERRLEKSLILKKYLDEGRI